MMRLAGKAERGQGARGHHQTNQDHESEMQMWRQFRAAEKKRARARLLLIQQLKAVLEIAF
jgi:hypothetical protein